MIQTSGNLNIISITCRVDIVVSRMTNPFHLSTHHMVIIQLGHKSDTMHPMTRAQTQQSPTSWHPTSPNPKRTFTSSKRVQGGSRSVAKPYHLTNLSLVVSVCRMEDLFRLRTVEMTSGPCWRGERPCIKMVVSVCWIIYLEGMERNEMRHWYTCFGEFEYVKGCDDWIIPHHDNHLDICVIAFVQSNSILRSSIPLVKTVLNVLEGCDKDIEVG